MDLSVPSRVACSLLVAASAVAQSNVLLIAVDDLNDWVGCLGGHPQAATPNIDALAKRGVLFTNAHCQSPVCNPSRASVMSGRYPESTGIYFLNPPVWRSPVVDEAELLPRYFARAGYRLEAGGKLFHTAGNRRYFPRYAGNFGGFGPFPKKKLAPFPGVKLWDWGAFPERDEQLPDYELASWAGSILSRDPDSDTARGPLFLAAGFVTPHVPQYAPAHWLERFPADEIELPPVLAADLEDVPGYGVDLSRLRHIAPTQEWVEQRRQWRELVRTYLACVAFVDAQIGRVLAALEASPMAEETVVVLFSDHGFHLGEKERWAKRSLWRESTRVPLIIAGPGIAKGVRCDQPVQLLDIYPTLAGLCGLELPEHVEGHSLEPLLRDVTAPWPHVARISFGPENVALVSRTHRYIRYRDGSEELYDRIEDPNEWTNLAAVEESAPLLERYRARLPKSFHEILGKGSTGHRAFGAANARAK